MLQINNLTVSVEGKTVVDDFSTHFEEGKNYAILGKNGSGKSSLSFAVMWHPHYQIESWSISIDGEDILELTPDQRAKKWIFLAFQNIPEIPWVKLFEFLKLAYNSSLPEWTTPLSFIKFKKHIQPLIEKIGIEKDFLFRDLNVWFSGGEKRKIEILQLELLQPKYIILDEVDSGLDINSLNHLGSILQSQNREDNTFIFISHYFKILDFVNPDEIIILENWAEKTRWDNQLLEEIKENWF